MHLRAIRRFATETRTGDRAELPTVPENAGVWPAVTSTRDNCLGAECPRFADCFVLQGAPRGAGGRRGRGESPPVPRGPRDARGRDPRLPARRRHGRARRGAPAAVDRRRLLRRHLVARPADGSGARCAGARARARAGRRIVDAADEPLRARRARRAAGAGRVRTRGRFADAARTDPAARRAARQRAGTRRGGGRGRARAGDQPRPGRRNRPAREPLRRAAPAGAGLAARARRDVAGGRGPRRGPVGALDLGVPARRAVQQDSARARTGAGARARDAAPAVDPRVGHADDRGPVRPLPLRTRHRELRDRALGQPVRLPAPGPAVPAEEPAAAVGPALPRTRRRGGVAIDPRQRRPRLRALHHAARGGPRGAAARPADRGREPRPAAARAGREHAPRADRRLSRRRQRRAGRQRQFLGGHRHPRRGAVAGGHRQAAVRAAGRSGRGSQDPPPEARSAATPSASSSCRKR